MTDQALNPPPRAAGAGRPADAAAAGRGAGLEGEAQAVPRAGGTAPAAAGPDTGSGAAGVTQSAQQVGRAAAGRAAAAAEGGEPVPPAGPPHAGCVAAAGAEYGIVTALPEGTEPFVGRTRELAELRGEIGRGGLGPPEGERARVLLVAGRPGAGRTEMAVRLARKVAQEYPDGQFFVTLTRAGGEPVPPGRAVRALLRALGAGPGGPDPAAALREATRGRRLLLVLDDAGPAGQLTALLPQSRGSLVIATSGGPLSGVPDVRPCTLGGLDTPSAVELLSHSIGGTRVTNDPRAAESLVQEVAGHPTALRLIAAWLAARPRLSVADAAATVRSAPATPPQQPAGRASTPAELVRAFRLVYAALPATAARMLRLLVLAPQGCVDAQVASALAGCSVAAARGTLDDFVTGGLLHGVHDANPRDTGGGGADGNGGGNGGDGGDGERQYRVPGCLEPLLQALVATSDRPQDVRLARARMLERTVRLLQACWAALAGEAPADGLPRTLRFGSAAAAADWLRARLPALLACARVAVADGELDTLARRLVAALVRALAAFPGGDAMAAERYELHSLVRDVAERRGLHREQAAALINLADLDAESGRSERALDTYRKALDAARAGDDTEAEGRVLEALGGTYLEQQDLPRASDWFGRALALRQARGELPHQARLHARIGSVLTYQGRYGPALREWRSAAGVYRRLGDLPSQARALTEAARVQEYAGHPEDALRTCRDALYWARQAGERRLEAAVLLRLADALDRLGDPGGARLQRVAAKRLFPPGEFPAF